jgi:CRP-like cAMP-binding protein
MSIAFAKALLESTHQRGVEPDQLSEVLDRCEDRRLQPGMVVCKEKKEANELFFLLEGAVSVIKTDPRGRLHELAALSAPALLGHMALIERTQRSATCMTKTPVHLRVLERDAYESLLKEPSGAGRAMRRLVLGALAKQLASGNARLRDLLAPEAEEQQSDDTTTEGQLVATTAALEGWHQD